MTTAEAALGVGGYAALLSTAGLGWQVFDALERRRTRMKVIVRRALIGQPTGAVPSNVTAAVTVEAINRSEHPVRVKAAGLFTQEQQPRAIYIYPQPAGAQLPGIVAPHDSGLTHIAEAILGGTGLDLTQPIVGFVDVATGQTFRSKPRQV